MDTECLNFSEEKCQSFVEVNAVLWTFEGSSNEEIVKSVLKDGQELRMYKN